MNTIAINSSVSWKEPVVVEKTATVTSVKLFSVNCILSKGSLCVTAPYQWLDADGKEVRRGVNQQNEASLSAAIGDAFPALKASIVGLMDTNAKMPAVIIQIKPDGTLASVSPRADGKASTLSESELNTALQSIGGVATLKNIIQSLAVKIVKG